MENIKKTKTQEEMWFLDKLQEARVRSCALQDKHRRCWVFIIQDVAHNVYSMPGPRTKSCWLLALSSKALREIVR